TMAKIFDFNYVHKTVSYALLSSAGFSIHEKFSLIHFLFPIPDFSRARAVQEQGISARRRSVLLRELNNAVPVPLWLAFGEEHQMPFFILQYYILQFRT
ncbi:MAG: hypothetical protein V3S72_03560, partial [Desulfobacterales bacterium]